MANTAMEFTVAEMEPSDWPAVRAIYLEGIATENATFETSAPDWEKWNRDRLPDCRFVARGNGSILGWAALSPVSSRKVYAGVAEVSIYVSASARRHGVGAALMTALVESSERAGIWTLQAGIFPENVASVELCRRAGFRMVGTRERLGCMNGRWRDVALMERRSTVAGL